MRDLKPPFQFDLRDLVLRARRQVNDRVSGVSINLPFVSFSVIPQATEKKAAKEIVIRLADRRVLNAFECCDDCIDKALGSLQEIRSFLVDKQVEISNFTEGPLYLVIEFMIEGIRQFFTFEEKLQNRRGFRPELSRHFRGPEIKEKYFAALEMLRAHLHRCLLQVAAIADTKIPKISEHMRYNKKWQMEAYAEPALKSGIIRDSKGLWKNDHRRS